MTETRLRTRTHCIGYLASAVCFLVAAMINLRYGFYELFFAGLVITALALVGALYTIAMRREQLHARGHNVVLVLIGFTAITAMSMYPQFSYAWLYPLLLLSLMILRIRIALTLSAAMIILALITLVPAPNYELITVFVSMTLLTGIAAWFAFRYHHSARFVDTLTIVDSETGAYNRRCFDETLTKEISRSEATGHPLSLACLSIDHFDELVSLHGRAELQGLLQAISEHLGTTMRAGDSHYRADENQFYLLLPFTPEEGLRVIAERIRRVLAESTWPVAQSVTASLGCTTRNAGETNAEALVSRCHEALKRASRRGHDQVWHLNG